MTWYREHIENETQLSRTNSSDRRGMFRKICTCSHRIKKEFLGMRGDLLKQRNTGTPPGCVEGDICTCSSLIEDCSEVVRKVGVRWRGSDVNKDNFPETNLNRSPY